MEKKKQWLGAKQVRARYNHIGEMTLWRWVNDPESKFPRPVKMCGRRYWDEADLDRYDESLKAAAA